MTRAPKRRWFAFSLRTMFAVVTLFGCWLGYELNWIRQRQVFIRDEAVKLARFQEEWPKHWRYEPRFATLLPNEKSQARAPRLLWLFGERGQSIMMVAGEDQTVPFHAPLWSIETKARAGQARWLFPEARILTIDEKFWKAPVPAVAKPTNLTPMQIQDRLIRANNAGELPWYWQIEPKPLTRDDARIGW